MRNVILFIYLVFETTGVSATQLNRSPEFLKIYQAIEGQSRSEIEGFLAVYFQPYKVLLVKGIFNGGSIFFEEQKWFKAHRIEFKVVDTVTAGTVEQNVPILYKEIIQSKKPVIIMSHSRGGVDTLSMLLQHPDLWRTTKNVHQPGKVIYWLAVHTPFYGTLSGELTKRSFLFRDAWENVLEKSGGAKGSMDTFSISGARNRLEGKTELLEELARSEFPKILTFGSWISPATNYNWSKIGSVVCREYSKYVVEGCHFRWYSPKVSLEHAAHDIFEQPVDYNQIFSLIGVDVSYQSIRSDGFVFYYSMRLPNVPFVVFPGLDHWDLSSDDAQHRPPFLKPADFLNSLFFILMKPSLNM